MTGPGFVPGFLAADFWFGGHLCQHPAYPR